MNNYFKKGKLIFIASIAICMIAVTSCKKDVITKQNAKANNETGGFSLKAAGITRGIADVAFDGYNRAFLYHSGTTAYYKNAISKTTKEGSWGLCLDMQGAMDAYERTGRADYKTLVNDLLSTFLVNNPTSDWVHNNWNDDLGWYGLALVRAYMQTGNSNFLTQARYAFDVVWARGWDTQYNGGGIWELQPVEDTNPHKEPLSTNSIGLVAAMIYQSSGDHYYLDRALQIYDWSWNHLFDANSGLVYAAVERDGTINRSANVYNNGTWIDYANTMHNITGDGNYLRDAQRAADYVKNNMTNNGILSNTADYLVTYAAEYGRGLGHLCHDNNLYGTYGDWMVQNANSIWLNRRSDYNICWNGWNQQTPNDNNMSCGKFVSAVAWMQYTPIQGSDFNSGSTYNIISKSSGKSMDLTGGSTANGAQIIIWDNSNSVNQHWVLTNLGNNVWSIKSAASGLFLDLTGGSSADGTNIIQWGWNGGANQKWLFQKDANGYYSIVSSATNKAIDVNGGGTANGTKLIEWTVNGGDNQKWSIVP